MQKTIKKHNPLEKSLETSHHAPSTVGAQLKSINTDVLSTVWDELLGGGLKKMSEQISGTSSAHSGEMKPGQPVSLNKKDNSHEKQAVPRSEGHMEYFRKIQNADGISKSREDSSSEQKVNQIRLEIKKLIATSRQLEATFKSISVEQRVVKAGKYHENFFDFVLSLLRSARVRMEEGMSWASASKGKKQKKQQQQYWSMAKKHGTSFSLSSERSTATQTG